MTTRLSRFLLLSALQVSVAHAQCALPASSNNAKNYTVQTLTYEVVNGQPIQLDLYVPKRLQNPPLVVFIHGGGFHQGDKYEYDFSAAYLTQFGFAGASLNYRLKDPALPNTVFPGAVDDVSCAIRYLRYNSAALGINTTNIAVLGGSAGGNLAAMLGVLGGNGNNWNSSECPVGTDVSASVQIVADYYGLNIFNNPSELNLGQINNIRGYLGNDILHILINPITPEVTPAHYLEPGENLPPFILIHGLSDMLMPVTQSVDFYNLLVSEGFTAQLIELPNFPHNFPPWFFRQYPQVKYPDYLQAACAVINAFTSVLQPTHQPH